MCQFEPEVVDSFMYIFPLLVKFLCCYELKKKNIQQCTYFRREINNFCCNIILVFLVMNSLNSLIDLDVFEKLGIYLRIHHSFVVLLLVW